MEILNSQFNNCSFRSIHCALDGGSIALNQITSDGGRYGISLVQGHVAKASSGPLEKSFVNISNSRVIMRKRNKYGAILVYLRKDHSVDINIDSVSVTGAGGGIIGIYISNGNTDAGSKQNYATARIHNVSIEGLGVQLEQPSVIATVTPATISIISLRSLTISDCTIKNNKVTGIFLFATAFFQGNIILTNNSGINGGGIALYSGSFLVLDASTTSRLQIFNNSAAMFGGGIYVSQDIIRYRTFPERYTLRYSVLLRRPEDSIIRFWSFSGTRLTTAVRICMARTPLIVFHPSITAYAQKRFLCYPCSKMGSGCIIKPGFLQIP